MKTADNTIRTYKLTVFSLILILLAVVLPCRSAAAATFPLYINSTGTSNITITGDAGTTNIQNNNTTSRNPCVTIFTTSSPTAASTRLQRVASKSSTTTLARVYFNYNNNNGFASSVTLSANITGSFYLSSGSSSNTNDWFQFTLYDYDPANVTGDSNYMGTAISSAVQTSSPGTGTTGVLRTVTFDNAAYTLPKGHFLAMRIEYHNGATGSGTLNRTGYVHCNSNYQSKLDVEGQVGITASTTDSNGTISSPGTTLFSLSFPTGSSKSYHIAANSGYVIQNVLVDGTTAPGFTTHSATFDYTFSNINASHTITASFVSATGTFTLSPHIGGSISIPSVPITWSGPPYSFSYSNAPAGSWDFVVTPDTANDYAIEWVKLDGVNQTVSPSEAVTSFPITVVLTTGVTRSLEAQFIKSHTVTTSIGGSGVGGSIDPPGSSKVRNGDSITLNITPDTGYRILSITDNGVTVPNPTTAYTIDTVTGNHAVVVTFQKTYSITATAGPNGTISPVGEVIVDSGADRNFSLTGNLGYRVKDVLVDGTSVGAVTAYTFSNVSADHTISVTFETAPLPSTYCAIPPFIASAAPPNVMLMLSVETPMQGAANPSVTCTGTPSSTTFTCSTTSSSCSANGALGCYLNTREYYGYFESGKCYSYSGSGATGLFTPSGAATNHQCGGAAWSGNFLNWLTMTAVDAFRKAFTGGNRTVDDTSDTVLLASYTNEYFPDKVYVDNAENYTPYSGTRYFDRKGAGIGFGICKSGKTGCTVSSSGSGESRWPSGDADTDAVFSLRIKACSTTGGTETRCNSANNKPEGTIQKYMDKMRFALMSYSADSTQERDGGILRSVMKWVGPTIQVGMQYHNSSGTVATCATSVGCENPEREVETNGTFRNNPAGASGANSGIINYINKFAYASGYKGIDPIGEMYYEVVRYFKNLTPSVDKYCSGFTDFTAGYADGFAFHCNSTKTDTWGWRDPALYPCSQNFVIAINDANPWLDKRIPGSAFKGAYGGLSGSGKDWCGSSQGACDSDFTDGGTQVSVEEWTNKVGDLEGLSGKTLNVACEVDATGACIGGISSGKNVTIDKLGRIIGTPPYPTKENSYNVAGLAYYAHMVDLRSDQTGVNNLTTYMIDTQEPAGSMLVGPFNMLYLAAKYGGFDDKDADQSVTIGSTKYNAPYKNSSCGGVSTTPNALCSEWDANNDGYPDTYFFASEAAKVENSLNTAFSSMLNRASSGTAAAVANNKSGERGANIIQALFYPQWPNDKNIKWLGEVQALWYYLDPVINYSGIYQDSDENNELDLTKDLMPGTDPFVTKALWKAGVELHKRDYATRSIYTLLNTSVPDLTNSANAFSTGNTSTLKPLLNAGSLTDTEADALINYLRGNDGGCYRSRTVTYDTRTACWKLGDIINSTPQIQSAVPTNTYHQIYADTSYSIFVNSGQYKSNNVVYSGANDGMLHAFRLGQVAKLNDSTKPFRIARVVDDTDLGKEEWAFIPANALPYMQNQADQNYCHQYLVDGPPVVVDASINKYSGCSTSNYWECTRQTNLVGGSGSDKNNYIADTSSWRSVLIGSMGLGGATRNGNCNETLSHDSDPANNVDCVKTPVAGSGYSSYFALDVTNPLQPKHLWEFSDAVLPAADKGLGLTSPGASVIRMNANISGSPDKSRNGRWFAVLASGPTGTVDTATRQFLGRSDQNLKIYVVDINPSNSRLDTGSLPATFTKCTAPNQSGCNYWVFETDKKFAFANSLSGSAVDLDRNNSLLPGYYSDDVVYITYTKASLDSDGFPVDWNRGGILRLVTNNDPDPANWFLSSLVDSPALSSVTTGVIGPITTSISKLQDRTNRKLWVYFGEGRYFYQGDNLNDTRRFFGVTDPCYSFDLNHINTLSTTLANCPSVTVSGLANKTNDATFTANQGWYVSMDASSGTSGAERVVSDVTATPNGIVFYTTFIPNSDLCTAGGSTSLWAVRYNSGGAPPSGGLKGKAPIQTSSGGIKLINLETAFTQKGGRKLAADQSPSGMAPKGRFPPLLQPKPSKRIMNIQEH